MKKVHINMCPILDGYGFMTFFNSRTRPRVNRLTEPAGGVMYSANLVASGSVCSSGRAVHNRAAACVAAGGGIFETQL